MNKNFVNACLALLVGLNVMANQGCIALVVGAAVGAGGFAYIKGNLEQNLDNSVEEVYQASLRALERQKIEVYSKKLEIHKAVIYGYAQEIDKKRVKVTIQALTEKASNIKIRYGIVGDESRSIDILEAIKKAL